MGVNASQFTSAVLRMRRKLRRVASDVCHRRSVRLQTRRPLISFTFDDFPQSALLEGGAILEAHGVRGTFFAALGLINTIGPTGRIVSALDVADVLARGHELGCHTFDHCHSWNTPTREFRSSVVRNSAALAQMTHGAVFKTFSYPISGPRPATKRVTGGAFRCCRGGGQAANIRVVDLNLVKAFFIEQSRHDFVAIEKLIASTVEENGWLVFATHDIASDPTRFGCTPAEFQNIVRCAVASGAAVLPVADALDHVTGRMAAIVKSK